MLISSSIVKHRRERVITSRLEKKLMKSPTSDKIKIIDNMNVLISHLLEIY